MKPADRVELFSRLRAGNPEPTTELEWSTPFELLAAVLLSAQATDRSVNLATRRLFPRANTPAAIVALGEAGLEPYLRTIGLWRAKAKHLVAACRMLIDEHGGEVPHDRVALERLPGVGRKTANVVLNTAFGEPTIAVDTHIFRVSNRLKLAAGKSVEKVEAGLLKAVPDEFLQDAHHWLILHGRYVCKARTPECWRCPVADLCPYRPKTLSPGERAAAKAAERGRKAAKAKPGKRSGIGPRTAADSGGTPATVTTPKRRTKPSTATEPPAKPAGPRRRTRDVQPES